MIDDDVIIQDCIALPLTQTGVVDVIGALTQEEGWKKFSENPDVKFIIMDGFVHGPTIPLIKAIRTAGYVGPIIASSGTPDFQDEQVKAGCSHKCDKFDVARLAEKWLTDPALLAAASAQSLRMSVNSARTTTVIVPKPI